MTARRHRWRLALPVGAFALLLALPALSAASSSEYPGAQARGFAHSAAGWSASVESSNLACLAGITCPKVSGFHVANGGTEGVDDGHLRTAVVGHPSLLTDTRIVWQSPNFTFKGVEGEPADSVELSFAQRNDAAALLETVDEAEYTVLLDNLSHGATLVMGGTIANAGGWTQVGPAALPGSEVVLGERYRIRIVTDLEFPVADVPSASFDLDDVVLRATRKADDETRGGDADPGELGPAPGELRAAKLRDGVLSVRVGCAKKADAKCRFHLAGRAKGKRSAKATRAGTATVKPGARKLVELEVKPRFQDKVARRSRMLFTGAVKAKQAKAKIVERLRLRRAAPSA